MTSPYPVMPAKAGIPLLFGQIGGDFNFFTNSKAGITEMGKSASHF